MSSAHAQMCYCTCDDHQCAIEAHICIAVVSAEHFLNCVSKIRCLLTQLLSSLFIGAVLLFRLSCVDFPHFLFLGPRKHCFLCSCFICDLRHGGNFSKSRSGFSNFWPLLFLAKPRRQRGKPVAKSG